MMHCLNEIINLTPTIDSRTPTLTYTIINLEDKIHILEIRSHKQHMCTQHCGNTNKDM